MRAPGFWTDGGWPATLLAPFGLITASLTARRVAKPGWQAPVPVFCCGNATVGGSGKTTLALDLLHRLTAMGAKPHALLRGYGGKTPGPLRVDAAQHDAALVGDEALLLAEAAPTWVAADRAAGGRAAVAAGAGAIVMDDGLQNPGLVKTCSLLVIDGGFGFGNAFLLPAGPLREPVAAAVSRCRAAVLIGRDEQGALRQLPAALPVLRGQLMPELGHLDPSGRYLAFAGIGRPEKFFAGLRTAGLQLVATESFADHHPYTASELSGLRRQAEAAGAVLLTTPKDRARLPASERGGIAIGGVGLIWDDPGQIDALLRDALGR
ncbi:tetraacyldisaccharide 4'-kinase [Acidisoma cellulosilytica]|uniref:Tetraacyldisaccharide 4'-kinase n=1 Tax=Acidisoma cellulosilyticum TaxID=2802395 RepID=A0A963YZM7_9PROT|nr:tetraacyldisaccharide 4'-kinase [Acidisoma cellulosilyticum]MCB8879125.1 tetraacyldisaccharide 4'-kinase [Acidisoma cellulosilyticum]